MKFEPSFFVLMCFTLIDSSSSEDAKEASKEHCANETSRTAQNEDLTGGFCNFFRKLTLNERSAAKGGQALYEQTKYQEALTFFSIAIEKDEACAGNYISRAKCYLKLGKLERAVLDFEEVAKRDDSSSTEHHKLVIKGALEFEQFHEIMTQIKSVTSYGLAQVAYEMCSEKSFELALRSYSEALLKDKYKEYYLSRAMCYVDWGKLHEARLDFMEARTAKSYQDGRNPVPVTSDQLGLQNERVDLFEAWANSTLSIEDLERIMSLGKEEAVKEGLALLDEQKYQEALVLFCTAIDKNECSASSYIARAKCFVKVGKFRNAVSDFKKVINMDDFITSENRKLVINAIVDLDEYQRIIKGLGDSISVNLFIQQANKMCSEKQFQSALRAFDGALLNKKCREHYWGRAACLIKMGRLNEARVDWSEGERYRSYYKSLPSQHTVEAALGLSESKVTIIQDLLNSGVNNKDLEGKVLMDHRDYANVGNELFDAGKFKDALTFYNSAFTMMPLSEYLMRRGDCYTKLRQMDKAHDDHERARHLRELDKEVLKLASSKYSDEDEMNSETA